MSLKVGFIGTGGIARNHLENLKQLGVEYAAMCDVDEARARQAADEYGGKPYTDFRRMLDEVALDAVWVCVPPFAHGDAEAAVIGRGVHLFVEKPIALELDLALELEQMIKDAGVIASVGYQWRYLQSVASAKAKLGDEPIGMMLGYWVGGMPGVWWWRQRETSGGQVVEQTTHIFDLARYFGGEVTEVYAAHAQRFLHREVENFTVDDVGTVTLKFASGAIANISSACIAPYRVGLDIIAKGQVLSISGHSLTTVAGGERRSENFSDNAYLEEDRAFIEAIQTGDRSKVRSDYSDAVKTLRVTLAANESAATGAPVVLPVSPAAA